MGVVVVADARWAAEEAAREALVVEVAECPLVVGLAPWTTGDDDPTADGGVVDDGADDDPTGP